MNKKLMCDPELKGEGKSASLRRCSLEEWEEWGKSSIAADIAERRGWKTSPPKVVSNLHPDDILGVPYLTEEEEGGEE